jgi:hypothetical protein
MSHRAMTRGPLLAAIAACHLTSCGGTGDSGNAATGAPGGSNPNVATSPTTEELALATRLYRGTERTPAGFSIEPRPSNVTGMISTHHLKNVEVDPAAVNANQHFEMCTNDTAEAITWSERIATWNGQYADMTELNGNERYLEVVRVPRADVTALLRHRFYRCDFLDRSATDLRLEQGAAGTLRQRPIDTATVKVLAEYLWQFTLYNNSDYVVASSTGSQTGNEIRHAIRLAQLVRGASGSCDTVRVSDWTHLVDTNSGTMSRALTPIKSFATRENVGGAASCVP